MDGLSSHNKINPIDFLFEEQEPRLSGSKSSSRLCDIIGHAPLVSVRAEFERFCGNLSETIREPGKTASCSLSWQQDEAGVICSPRLMRRSENRSGFPKSIPRRRFWKIVLEVLQDLFSWHVPSSNADFRHIPTHMPWILINRL